ncbi:MAG: 3-hydroxyacyl-ACP dehydratase FabZ family protein [Planctomycetota bacterium]|nr:3-hydroxyacyl-ACP dehydratase FabZ family protein [Planctomycetota bacterium]
MSNDPKNIAQQVEFSQIDQITEIIAGERISAVKYLSGNEDYLQDHFPRFPVMPGVLMLEAMFQAASWLVRYTNNFSHSTVELREAKNIKFQNFVTPGNRLVVNAKIMKQDGLQYSMKTEGRVDDGIAVSGRLVVEAYNRQDRQPGTSTVDEVVAMGKRKNFELLYKDS